MYFTKIVGYDFEVGHTISTQFNYVPGIYVIYTEDVYLDVGQTHSLGMRIPYHDRKPDWVRNSNNKPIFLAFHYEANPLLRNFKESLLRVSLAPLCGDR